MVSLLRCAAILAVSCFGLSVAQAATVPVTIDNFTFSPHQVTVKPGDTVTWTNRDDIPHSVRASPPAGWKCAAMDTGESCSITFKEAGNFQYFCGLHPHMTGMVVVEPE